MYGNKAVFFLIAEILTWPKYQISTDQKVAEIFNLKTNFYFSEADHLQEKFFKQNDIYIGGMSDGEQNISKTQ